MYVFLYSYAQEQSTEILVNFKGGKLGCLSKLSIHSQAKLIS